MLKTFFAALMGGLMLLANTPSAAATFVVSVEAPGIQTTTTTFAYSGIESFDYRFQGNYSTLNTNFGGGLFNNSLTGTYSGVSVTANNAFGGTQGLGNYATTSSATGYSLNLNATDARGINYFGYWLSALDSGNQLSFYSGNSLVYSFSPTALLAMVGPDYYGNPNSAYAGQNSGQPYAFVNFYDTDGTFDRVTFSESPSIGGYESDNHTVGYYRTMSGTAVNSAVPEPATWAMMIGGFGLIGAMLRAGRRRPTNAGLHFG